MARGRFRGALDIGHDQGGIGRGLDEHHAQIARAANGGIERFGTARRHRDSVHGSA